jgi:O-succinylbenzoate synthase
MRACGIINIKLGRVGGFAEAKRVHDVAQAAGIPVWCGGMLEAGIGRAHNIALATLPNFVLPGDVSASKRYWKRDIISSRRWKLRRAGPSRLRDEPGFGYASTSISSARSRSARSRSVDSFFSCWG